jgi:hypothetical protein
MRNALTQKDREVLSMQSDLWTYRDDTMAKPMDIEGFDVAASDGDIGTIDEATYDVGAAYVVVDTGPWIFGRKVLLPAGAIERIDLDNRKVAVRLTKDQIKSSPELDETTDLTATEYRERVGTYYRDYL